MTQNITSLKDLHKGEDIYVLGSGTTLDFIDKDFFSNKITVSVNEVGIVYLPTTQYVVTKYHKEAIDFAQRIPVIGNIIPGLPSGAPGKGGTVINNNINIKGAIDPQATARTITKVQNTANKTTGLRAFA